MGWLIPGILSAVGTFLFVAPHHRGERSNSVTGPLTLWANFSQTCRPESDLPLAAIAFSLAAAFCCAGVFFPAAFAIVARFLPSDALRPAMVVVGLAMAPIALVTWVVIVFGQTGLGFGGGFALAKLKPVLKMIVIFELAVGAALVIGALPPFYPFASRALLGRD